MKLFIKKETVPIFIILTVTFLIKLGHLFVLKGHFYLLGEDELSYIEGPIKMMFNNMRPVSFIHGALYFDLMSLAYRCMLPIGEFLGWFRTDVDFLLLFLEKPAVFYSINRMVSVLLSTVAIYYIYRLGNYLWDKKTGFVAALFYSVMPLAMVQGTKASVYPLATLFIVLATIFGFEYLRETTFKKILKLGIMFGLALAADYYALFMIPFFLLIFSSSCSHKNWGKHILVFCVTAILIFIGTNPYFLISPDLVWRYISLQAQEAISISCLIHPRNPFSYIRLMLGAPYQIISLLFIAGIWLSARQKRKEGIALLLFPLVNIIFFSLSKIQNDQYVFHSLPFISLIAANAAMVLIRHLKLNAVSKTCLILFIFVSLQVPKVIFIPRDPSRETWSALEWAKKNIPKKSAIMIQPGTVPFAAARLSMVLFDETAFSDEQLYLVTLDRYLKDHPDEDYNIYLSNFSKITIPVIAGKRIGYIVLPNWDYDQDSVDWLQQNAALIKAYGKEGNSWRIRIYKVLNFS